MDRLPSGVYFESYEKDMAVVQTNGRWLLLVSFLAFLFLLPLSGNERILAVLNAAAISTIAALGLNILTGMCGQISLGHAAFVCVGAYVSAILTTRLGLPFWVGLIIAPFGAGCVGIAFGLPSLRVKGFYLIMATLAAQIILVNFLPYQLGELTAADTGLPVNPPQIGGIVLDTEGKIYYLMVGLAALMTFFSKNIARTKVGRALVAIRDRDLAATVLGVPVYRYKLLAFFIGCFYAGLAGALFAHYTRIVTPEFFSIDMSILYLGMIIVGGMGRTAGSVIGAVFFTCLTELTNALAPLISESVPYLGRSVFTFLNLAIPAILIAIFMIYEPRGLFHRWEIMKAYFQWWPYSKVT